MTGDKYGNTSRQVSWWTVHEFVQPHIDLTDGFPVVGTVAWQLLSDKDPAKWAAVLDAAQHHALRLDLCQEASIQAAQAISVSQDWSAVAQKSLIRRAFYEARPWLRRKEVA